ncbi:tetratricopeptide repeat protein [Streptomyces sp. NPDC047097]|uniref:tetratricopeptide repeat protein n=1 Tax=Streptomyces sp. NPDC047097 TaxID=3155260 RepID=UPI0033C93A90
MADTSDFPRPSAHGGDAYRGDITEHRLAKAVRDAWHSDSPDRRTALAGSPPPGAIALRCRYRHVADSVRTGAVLAPVALESWNRSLIAETEIDNAVHTGDFARAARMCEDLARQCDDEVTLVNALIGSGDVLRALGRAEEATGRYESALRHSGSCLYRFGRLRALVGMGHLALAHHSAVRATELFEEALGLAEQLEDPLYAANAVSGLGESAERGGALNRAVEMYERAHALYVEVAGVTGQAHAAQRVGVLHHRAGRPQAAGTWLVLAARAFERFDDPVGTVNVLESIGDLLLDVGDVDEAEARYQEAHALAVDHRLASAMAHAAQNFGRVAQARGDRAGAIAHFEQAGRSYRAQGDLLGLCNALTRLADSRDRLPDGAGRAAAVRDRVSAVFAIEEYRAAHHRADAQQEYRRRFSRVYASALRAAVRAGAPESFVVVADGLAGRRLAGLATRGVPPAMSDRLTLLQHLLVSSDQRWLAQSRPPGTGGMRFPAETPRQERLIRLLGSTAIGGAVREPARDAVEDLLAAVYLPPAHEGAALLASLPSGCHTLQLVIDPEEPLLLHRMWRDDRGGVLLDSTELSRETAELLAVVRTDSDEHSALRPRDLVPLSSLLPDQLRRAIAEGSVRRLLLVPASELWLVPWGAVPVAADRLLSQDCAYMVCPSLALQRELARRGPCRPVDRPTHLWRSPLMRNLELTGLRGDGRWTFAVPESGQEAKAALGAAAHTAVVLCHGRPADGPGHYLELDTDAWLLPADILSGTPPQRLYLFACWGTGVPGLTTTEPVTIATLALVRASVEVLATVGEYGDTPDGDQFAQWVLELLSESGVPAGQAVHEASRRILDLPGAWDWPVRDWAVLVPLGTFHSPR